MNVDRPVDNAPFLSYTHNGFTIEGYSRAAVQSYWRIPELNVGFDLGAHPWDFMGTPTWFISHAHLDHIAALPVYVARRRMMKMPPPTVYVPAESREDVEKLLRIMQRLDRGRQAVDLRGVVAGQVIELDRQRRVEAFDTVTTDAPINPDADEELAGHDVTAFDTVHTIPSRGFVVWEVRNKLKDEYVGRPGSEIRDLRLSGVEITREARIPLVCYTGDTAPAGLENSPTDDKKIPAAYSAKILITEMSFIREKHRRDKIHKFGHMHLDDFVERADRFRNELIVAAHFSTRYHPSEVRRLLETKLPSQLKAKMRLWV
jgi:ribonuclease Z